MQFSPTPEQIALVGSATQLAEREFGRVTSRRDLPEGVPRSYLTVLANNGFSGMTLPESDGGQGASLLDTVLVIEAIARVHPTGADAVQALNFGAVQQLAHIGTPEQKQEFLTPLLRGQELTAIAMTESEAGSAVTELRTSARREQDHVVLRGGKIFTTHGADADFFVVWVRFGEGRDAIGAVVVRRDDPGFGVDGSNRFVSGEHYGVLSFDDCVVPADRILIEEHGLKRMLPVFNIERLGNSARSLALGQAALDLALEHASSREQFGHSLADFQGLRWRFADIVLQLQSARLLLHRAAVELDDNGVPRATHTAMAKLACNRAGYAASDLAVQVFGGQGFDDESLVSYLYHRTRGWMIAGGTVEQMQDRIARDLFRNRP